MAKMKQGVLPRAQVFDDVQTMKGSDLSKYRPVVITAGFPCQDISSENCYGKGIGGEKSGLVVHVIRLACELPSVTHVFLENTPMIQHRGLHHLEDCLKRHGFTLRQAVISAQSCGAPHQRRRWWCLASRGMGQLRQVKVLKDPWARKEPCQRLVRRQDGPRRSMERRMIQCLGSSVVPIVAQVAWNTLIARNYTPPVACIKFTPLRMRHGATEFTLRTWATPMTQASSSLAQEVPLTSRNSTKLGCQIYYDTATAVKPIGNRRLSDDFDINLCFISYLMGYPLDYCSGAVPLMI